MSTIQLTVEPNEVQMIMAGLGKIPLENSIDLWFKVKMQAERQLQPAPAPAPVPAPAPAPAPAPVVEPLSQADVRPVE